MTAVEIAPNIHWVGVQDPELRLFDVYLQTDHGTSYNAYLIRGETGTALIDTVKAGFQDEFFARLSEVVDPAAIDYLILSHLEPDHSGVVADLLAKAPDIRVICSRSGAHFLRNLLNRDISPRLVEDGDTLDLGGRTLRFITTPFLHWPDTMVSYLPEEGILFSNDVFGTHHSDPALFDDLLPDFSEAFAYYFDHIMRPFKEHVARAMAKLEGLDLRMIATGHGPIRRKDPRSALTAYREWSRTRPAEGVLLIYASIYGKTELLAKAIAQGLAAAGVSVERRMALDLDPATMPDLVEGARGVVVGSPTVNGDAVRPVWDLLSAFPNVKAQGKWAGAFGSYGWSGEAVGLLTERLKGLRFHVLEPGPRAILTPSEDDLSSARAFGRELGEKLR